MLPSWLDKAVTYLSTSDNLYLNNISIVLELQNKYDLNPGDPDYDIYNDDLTLKDEGDFITLQKIFVKPKVLPDKILQSKEELSEKEQFILIKLKKFKGY